MVLGEPILMAGCHTQFKIVLFKMLAGQYHTNRLAVGPSYSGPGHTAPISHTHKKTQRVSLGVIRGEDQYGTGPSIYEYFTSVLMGSIATVMVSYGCHSIGEYSFNMSSI